MDEDKNEYGLGEAVERPKVETQGKRKSSFVRSAPVRRRIPRAPPWNVFFKALLFPWTLSVLPFWAFTSIGFIVLGELGIFVLLIVLSGGPGLGMMIVRTLGVSTCVLGIGVFSYASAGWWIVIEETSAGNDSIDQWPDGDWRDWVVEFACYVVLWAALAGYGIGLVMKLLFGFFWLPLMATMIVLFPFLLLSSLEAESRWMPFSRPIARSLKTCWTAWLLLTAEGLTLTVLCLGIVALGVGEHPFIAMLVVGPIFSAAVLIYARSLGWLARLVVARGGE